MKRKNCIKTKHLLTLLLIFGIFVLYCSFNRYRHGVLREGNLSGILGGDDEKNAEGDDDDDELDHVMALRCHEEEAGCKDDMLPWVCDEKMDSCFHKKIEKDDQMAEKEKEFDKLFDDADIKQETKNTIKGRAVWSTFEKILRKNFIFFSDQKKQKAIGYITAAEEDEKKKKD